MVRLQSCRAGNLECFQCLDLLRYLQCHHSISCYLMIGVDDPFSPLVKLAWTNYLGEREGDRELERERERYLLGLLLLLELLLYRRLLHKEIMIFQCKRKMFIELVNINHNLLKKYFLVVVISKWKCGFGRKKNHEWSSHLHSKENKMAFTKLTKPHTWHNCPMLKEKENIGTEITKIG